MCIQSQTTKYIKECSKWTDSTVKDKFKRDYEAFLNEAFNSSLREEWESNPGTRSVFLDFETFASFSSFKYRDRLVSQLISAAGNEANPHSLGLVSYG